jgi:hypothetical protein
MKNILAENMLRFGVKNLSESDITKIEKSVLTEAFTDSDGYTYPNIKDAQSLEKFIAVAQNQSSQTPTAAQKLAIQALFANPGTPADGQYNDQILIPYAGGGVGDIASAYFMGLAIRPGIPVQTDIPDNPIIAFNTGINGISVQFKKAFPTANWYKAVLQAVSSAEARKWWATPITFPLSKDPNAPKQTRWKIYADAFMRPYLANVQKYLVFNPAPPKPGAPSTQPTTAKAPVKPQ